MIFTKLQNYSKFVFLLFFLLLLPSIFFSKTIFFANAKTSVASKVIENKKTTTKPRKKRQAKTDCHITKYDAIYAEIWTTLFKKLFPKLKKSSVKKIWVVTDFSQTPFLHQEFDISAFAYHGTEKYQTWKDIPDEVKCSWFDKYPNDSQKNPWLSSGFLTLRGLYFFEEIMNKYNWISWFKFNRTKEIPFLNQYMMYINHFLNLTSEEVHKTLEQQKFTISLENTIFKEKELSKNFLYMLGLHLSEGGPLHKIVSIRKGAIAKNSDYYFWLKVLHSDAKQMLASQYKWNKTSKGVSGWFAYQISQYIRKTQFFITIYKIYHPLFWELAHYKINEISLKKKTTNISVFNKEVQRIKAFVDLSDQASKEMEELFRNYDKNFEKKLQAILLGKKQQIFWKILQSFLLELEKNEINEIKNLNIIPLFPFSKIKNFEKLTSTAQTVVNSLITEFTPSLNQNSDKRLQELTKLHKDDSQEEIGQFSQHLKELMVAKTVKKTDICPALTESKYQKWWEIVFAPLVPKLIKYKVAKIYYGLLWEKINPDNIEDDRIYDQDIFFDPRKYNYYGATKYTSYSQVPNEIKCKIPSYIFNPRAIQTLKSLEIFLNIVLPRLKDYQKFLQNFISEAPNLNLNHYLKPINLNAFQGKTEQDIFALIQKEIIANNEFESVFAYLGFGIPYYDNQLRENYIKAIDSYFLVSKFWLKAKVLLEKTAKNSFFTNWKGVDITLLKKLVEEKYNNLDKNSKDNLKRLLTKDSFVLLVKKLTTLTNHLSKLNFWWKQFQLIKKDLKKYKINQLEKTDFASLLSPELKTPDPWKLRGESKQKLINLMEIDDFFSKLTKLISKEQAKADKKAKQAKQKKLLIILLSTLLPLAFLGLVVGGYIFYKKRKKKAVTKTKTVKLKSF